MRLDLLSSLNAEVAAARPAVVVTALDNGEQRLLREIEIESDALADIAIKQLRAGKSARVTVADRDYFLDVHLPASSLVVIGAVHISQTLAPAAQLLGYRVTIVDPRSAFATKERFPDVSLLAEWPDQALAKISLTRWTAFVALTHDPRIDDPALVAALKADCFYVGALGSRKTHAERLQRLAVLGIPEGQLSRIRGPVGLSIGAATPAEIAVAILAEITARRRLPSEPRA